MIPIPLEEEPRTNCCDAKFIPETDICSAKDCREHAEPIEEEEITEEEVIQKRMNTLNTPRQRKIS